MSNYSVLNPSNSFSVFPFSVLFFSFGIDIDTFSMLFAFIPVSNVSPAIWPLECALSLLHVVHVLSDILSAIWPCEGTMSFHFVVLPITSVNSAICPLVNTSTVDVVVEEITSESALICPGKFTLPMLLTLRVLTLV